MRKNHIDWLRNLGILFLFPYHAARVFNEDASFYVKGEVNAAASVLVQLSYWFMPLLFLLAGTSSHYALQRRTARTYVGERVSRLVVPFVFGVLVVVPPQAYFAKRFHRGYEGSYPEFLRSYFTDFSDWSEYEGGISPAHLWFILFLFLISVALVRPMARMVASGHSAGWMRHPLLIVLPAAGVVALSLLPDVAGKNIFVYAAYFLLGFLIATDDAIMATIQRCRRLYLSAAGVGAAGVLADPHAPALLGEAWKQLACWVTLLAMLGYGHRYLNGTSRFMTYFNPAAFPVYVLHQTYLVIVAYYVLGLADGGVVPYVLIMTLSFALSIATYDLVRRVNPARAVFGMPRLPRREVRTAGR
ncbi:acyltransferase family protein [Actinomadura miaoliensis]|uniref:Acyltransferase 3 domain-containing protein n=1 Tax=Actinomadura miaoliensis TaxID=430685 RepID=A0ABP7WLN3_9ACTN